MPNHQQDQRMAPIVCTKESVSLKIDKFKIVLGVKIIHIIALLAVRKTRKTLTSLRILAFMLYIPILYLYSYCSPRLRLL